MTGIEHYRKGEEILADAESRLGNAGFDRVYVTNLIALAHAHFAAAKVAATIVGLVKPSEHCTTNDQAEWLSVVGEQS